MDWTEVSRREAEALLDRQESHFWDVKSARSGGAAIEKIGSCFANADGGEFLVGVEDSKVAAGLDRWHGFRTIEDGNYVQQALTNLLQPNVPYAIQWLAISGEESRGFAALVTVFKSPSAHRTSKDEVWQRNGAQCLRLTGTAITNLSLSKGAASYEDQLLERFTATDLAQEAELISFLTTLSPTTEPLDFVRKQRLVDRPAERATVASAVLFAEVPPAAIPKKCSLKIARYETSEVVPSREHLLGTPLTIEGPARVVIDRAIEEVTKLVEAVSILEPDGSLTPARYPPEALKELIVNAVIHRDYNLSDDILVSVYDNRVEVRSPGKLPGHITIENILDERFARNPTIVRLLNKYPDPPNKDIGEGLNTVVAKMVEAKLNRPDIRVEEDAVVVVLNHTPLARPEEIVIDYLGSHSEITNATGRQICGIGSENVMKRVFLRLAYARKIERVPGKEGNKAAWRRVDTTAPADDDDAEQQRLFP